MSVDSGTASLTPGRMVFKSAFIYNPVLTQAIGLCPIAAAAYSIKAAGVLAGVLTMLMILNEFLACFLMKKLPRWLRISFYLIFSTAILAGLMPLFDSINPDIGSSVGIYLPLLAVNSLVVVRCENFAVSANEQRTKPKAAFYCLLDALSASIGYAVVIVIVAFVREQLVNGAIFGLRIEQLPKISAMAMPFGGMIVLGFLAAVHKMTIRRFFPQEPTDSFDFSSSLKSPLLIDPGIHARESAAKLFEEPFTEKDIVRQKQGIVKESSVFNLSDDIEQCDENDPFSMYEYNPESEYVKEATDLDDDDEVNVAIPKEEDAGL